MNQVTIYTTQTCSYCIMAKRLLASKGITPVEINVGGNPQLMQELMQKTGRRTVPQIYFGEQHVARPLALAPSPGGEALTLNGARLECDSLQLPPGAAFILPL